MDTRPTPRSQVAPFQVSTQALYPRGSAGDPRLPLPGPGPLPFLWELSPSLQMSSRAPHHASWVCFCLECRSAHSSHRQALPPARRWPTCLPSTPLRTSPLSFVSRKRHRPEHRPARNQQDESSGRQPARSQSRDEVAASTRFLFVASVTHAGEGAARSLQVRDFRAASGTGCWLSALKP